MLVRFSRFNRWSQVVFVLKPLREHMLIATVIAAKWDRAHEASGWTNAHNPPQHMLVLVASCFVRWHRSTKDTRDPLPLVADFTNVRLYNTVGTWREGA